MRRFITILAATLAIGAVGSSARADNDTQSRSPDTGSNDHIQKEITVHPMTAIGYATIEGGLRSQPRVDSPPTGYYVYVNDELTVWGRCNTNGVWYWVTKYGADADYGAWYPSHNFYLYNDGALLDYGNCEQYYQ